MLSDTPDMNFTTLVLKIASTAGVARSTVCRIIKEYRGTGMVTPSKRSGGRPRLVAEFDEATKGAIRRVIHNFFHKNELPTLDKILREIKYRPDLPQMSRSSLYKLMKHINFKFLKRNRKSVLIERDDIIRWRRRYLKDIKQYRQEGRIIYYLDETWINEGHTKQKVWSDENIVNRRQAFVEGLSTGLKNPSGKGKRLIILHVGSENGFVDDGLLIFEGKKTTDYHEEMNAAVFEKWFSALLNRIPENSVIVMDNAPYHSRKQEKIPTSCSRKSDMQEWLQSKQIDFDADMVRSELLHLIQLHRDKYNTYVTDEMAVSSNKIVLRLPPYHCELNPIEMIWAKIKNEVASKNKTFKLKEVKELFHNAVANVSPDDWCKCVQHVIEEESKMCRLDGQMDTIIEPLIVSLSSDDSNSFSELSEDSD